MRWITGVLVLAAACKGGKHDASSTGSATPPPVTPPVAAPADAEPAAAFSQAITSDGIGPINASTDPAAVASLFPGLTAKVEHAEASGRSIDTTSLAWPSGVTIAQLVVDNIRNEVRADAVAANFATAKGVRVGSTITELVTAYPDTECRRETVPETSTQALYCTAVSLPNIQFHLDPAALTGTDGKVPAARLQAMKLTRIRWVHARPSDGTATAAAGELKPFCLAAGADLVVDRLVLNGDSLTFCAPGEGSLSCGTVSLATGEVTTPATPPAKPAEADTHVDTENARKLQRGEGGVWTVVDTHSQKTTATLKLKDSDHTCIGDAQFVGPAIYVEAQACDKHQSVGYLFKPTGEAIGRIDAANLYKSRPFMIDGDRALLHASDSTDVVFVQVSKAKQAITPTATPEEAEGIPTHVMASVTPFVKLPGNKVASVGSSVAVLDPETGALEKHFLLPTCK